jgi:decaprenyl-phosphate phosphoribosyltransferase
MRWRSTEYLQGKSTAGRWRNSQNCLLPLPAGYDGRFMTKVENAFTEVPAEGEQPVFVQTSPAFWRNVLKTARPKQWVKNVLVFAAPAAAGRLTEADVLGASLLAFAAFLLASIGTYFVNDALDHEADRLHPTKRWRPVAAGWLSLPFAWSTGFAALVAGLALGFLDTPALGFLILGYVAMTLSYGIRLKHVPIVDLTCVAAGFVLRMIAGGLATGIPISAWFLTVASFSSLFVVAGKRYGEVREVGEGNAASRSVLDVYTAGFLRSAWIMAMTVSIATYCQWAFTMGDASTDTVIWYQLSAVPWAMALLRYAMLLDGGQGGAPEDVLARDRLMQVFGVIWLGFFLVSVYA